MIVVSAPGSILPSSGLLSARSNPEDGRIQGKGAIATTLGAPRCTENSVVVWGETVVIQAKNVTLFQSYTSAFLLLLNVHLFLTCG
jgi:hypothetical protein